MPFLPILLSKIKLNHVSELSVTCWVGWVCVGGVPPLVLFLPKVQRSQVLNTPPTHTHPGIIGRHIFSFLTRFGSPSGKMAQYKLLTYGQ